MGISRKSSEFQKWNRTAALPRTICGRWGWDNYTRGVSWSRLTRLRQLDAFALYKSPLLGKNAVRVGTTAFLH